MKKINIKTVIVLMGVLASCVVSFFGFHNPIAPIDGDIYAVHSGNVMYGIRAALEARAGTMIMMKDEYVMFVWNIRDGFAFVALDLANRSPIEPAGQIAHGGNLVNCATMACLSEFLKTQGWKAVPATAVPEIVRATIGAANSWLVSLSASMVTFVIVPVGVYDLSDIYPTYQE